MESPTITTLEGSGSARVCRLFPRPAKALSRLAPERFLPMVKPKEPKGGLGKSRRWLGKPRKPKIIWERTWKDLERHSVCFMVGLACRNQQRNMLGCMSLALDVLYILIYMPQFLQIRLERFPQRIALNVKVQNSPLSRLSLFLGF